MSATATTGSAWGALLGTVATTANTATSLIGTVNNSVTMFDAFVNKAREEQRKSHIAASEAFDIELATNHAQRMTDLMTNADTYCSKSARHKELFNQHYKSLMSKLNPNSNSESSE